MRRYTEIRLILSILMAAILVVAMDVVLMPILLEFYFQSSRMMLVYDFGIVLFAGSASLLLAPRVGCPFWWRQGDSSPASRRVTYITLLLGLSVVVTNTLLVFAFANQSAQIEPWIAMLTPESAIAISLRAALNEEIVFRLFLFPLMMLLIRYSTHSQKASLVTAALGTAILVGIIHPGFVQAFLIGLALVYIYYQRGLLPAMITHFFADAIPFLLISMTQ